MCFLLLLMVWAIMDVNSQVRQKSTGYQDSPPADDTAIRQLILLDDQNKPIKSWDLSGKIAVVIGKGMTRKRSMWIWRIVNTARS